MKFKNFDTAYITNTNSDLDDVLVRVTGLGLESIRATFYIVELPEGKFPNGWKNILISEHYLVKVE